jgi:hypothetical protein
VAGEWFPATNIDGTLRWPWKVVGVQDWVSRNEIEFEGTEEDFGDYPSEQRLWEVDEEDAEAEGNVKTAKKGKAKKGKAKKGKAKA